MVKQEHENVAGRFDQRLDARNSVVLQIIQTTTEVRKKKSVFQP